MDFLDRLLGRLSIDPKDPRVVNHKGDGNRKFGYSGTPGEWREERENYYEKWFGEIETVYHEIVEMTPHIDIYRCKPDTSKGRDYYTLITGGMSDLPMNIPPKAPKKLRRAELLLYVTTEEVSTWQHGGDKPWQVNYLYNLASFVHAYKTWLGMYHTISNGDPPDPIAPGSILTNTFLIPPFFESPSTSNGLVLDADPVNFLWVFPITNAECNFKMQHGGELLLDIIEQQNPALPLDAFRKSYV